MKAKRLLMLLTLMFAFSGLKAQYGATMDFKYIHSFGGSFMLSVAKQKIAAPGLSYYPKLNVVHINHSSSFSLGIPFTVGQIIDPVDDEEIAYEIPFVMDYNFGFGSTHKGRTDRRGLFIGVGYGYNSISNEQQKSAEGLTFLDVTHGGYIHAGGRYHLLNRLPMSGSLYSILGSGGNTVVGARLLFILNSMD